jgi:hypothetical protein
VLLRHGAPPGRVGNQLGLLPMWAEPARRVVDTARSGSEWRQHCSNLRQQPVTRAKDVSQDACRPAV